MPKTRNCKLRPAPAVIVHPGVRALPQSTLTAQLNLIAEAAPYFWQADKRRRQDDFLQEFYNLWFQMWPEIPDNRADFDFCRHQIQLIKKRIRKDFILTGIFSSGCNRSWESFLVAKRSQHNIDVRHALMVREKEAVEALELMRMFGDRRPGNQRRAKNADRTRTKGQNHPGGSGHPQWFQMDHLILPRPIPADRKALADAQVYLNSS